MAQPSAFGHHSKKKILKASEQDRPDIVAARARFHRRRVRWNRGRLLFFDETGINLALTRAEGWAPRGKRVVDTVPGGRWETYSLIAAVSTVGVHAPMLVPGAVDQMAFRAWVRHRLAPQLDRGDLVLCDNLSVHDDPEALRIIERRGARLEFLPAYSPDLNPIERTWSKVKTLLRGIGARTRDVLVEAVGAALRAVTSDDCAGWFTHCGYRAK